MRKRDDQRAVSVVLRSKRKADPELRDLAERIARRLFTNGSAERAQRLVLTIDSPVSRNLGGLGERAAVDQILEELAHD